MEKEVRELGRELDLLKGEVKTLSVEVSRLSGDVAPDHESRLRDLEDSYVKIASSVNSIDSSMKEMKVDMKDDLIDIKSVLQNLNTSSATAGSVDKIESRLTTLEQKDGQKWAGVAAQVGNILLTIVVSGVAYFLLPMLKK